MSRDVALQADIALKHVFVPAVTVVIVLANGCFIYAIVARTKKSTSYSLTNYFVLALAFSDFLLGFPTLPMLLLAERQILESPFACLTALCLSVVTTSASSLLLIAVGVERYIAIVKPLQYHKLVTVKKATIGIGMCYVISLIVGLLPMFGWNTLGTLYMTDYGTRIDSCRLTSLFTGSYSGMLFCGLHLPLWIIMIFIYVRIMWEVHRQSLRRCSLTEDSHKGGCNKCSLRRRNVKVFRVLTILVGFYICSWAPLVVYYAVVYHGFRVEVLTPADVERIPSWVYPVGVSLAYANSAGNPFLYGFGNRAIRKTFKETLLVSYMGKFKNHIKEKLAKWNGSSSSYAGPSWSGYAEKV